MIKYFAKITNLTPTPNSNGQIYTEEVLREALYKAFESAQMCPYFDLSDPAQNSKGLCYISECDINKRNLKLELICKHENNILGKYLNPIFASSDFWENKDGMIEFKKLDLIGFSVNDTSMFKDQSNKLIKVE